jgi:hypothetical protein
VDCFFTAVLFQTCRPSLVAVVKLLLLFNKENREETE